MRVQLAYQEGQGEKEWAICLREMDLEELHVKSSQQLTLEELWFSSERPACAPTSWKEVDEYFTLFNWVAYAMKWPEDFRPLLLQSVLIAVFMRICLFLRLSIQRLWKRLAFIPMSWYQTHVGSSSKGKKKKKHCAGELQPLYIASSADFIQLSKNITGEPNRPWWPVI